MHSCTWPPVASTPCPLHEEAADLVTALAAVGFVVINPTDPEVIERATVAVVKSRSEPEGGMTFDGRSFAIATAVLAALGGDQ